MTHEELDRYDQDIWAYLALLPSITWLRQVEAGTSGCYVQRVACDRRYALTFGFRGDLAWLVRTVGVLFSKTRH